MKILSVRGEWADRRTDGHDEFNSCFSQFCERASNRTVHYNRHSVYYEVRTESFSHKSNFVLPVT